MSLAAICALALLLRVPNFLESVWWDELWATRIKLASLGHLVSVSLSDVHPPAYFAFMFGWIRLFGDSELAIRMPSLLFGLGAIVLTFSLGARMAGPRAGLVASLLLAVAPAHIWYSQEARMYSPVVFLSLLGILAHHRASRADDPSRALRILGLAMGAAVLAHYYVITMVAALAFTTMVHGSLHRTRLLAVLGGVSLALVGFLSIKLLLGGTLAAESTHLRAFTPLEGLRLMDWFTTGGTTFRGAVWSRWPYEVVHVGWWATITALVVAGLMHIRARSGPENSTRLALLLASIPALLLLLNWIGFGATYIERSALPILPVLLVAIAAGLDRFVEARPYRAVILAGVCVLATLPAIRLHQLADVVTVYKPNPDWRQAAEYLRRAHPGKGAIVLFGTSPMTELQYYEVDVTERWAWRDDVVSRDPQPSPEATGNYAAVKRTFYEIATFGGNKSPASSARLLSGEAIYLDGRAVCTIPGVLARTGSRQFFVVHNYLWSQDFENVLGSVVDADGYAVASRIELRGLVLTELVADRLSPVVLPTDCH